MTGPSRVTGPLLDVVEVFLQAFHDGAQLHGWAIAKATKRSGPTVYGVLDRLEDAAWITGQWEDQPSESNKPRRRLYRLTPTGFTAARDLLAARRPQALHHARRHQVRPEPGLAFVRWLRTLLPGGAPMTTSQILLAIITGLAVNERCDVSPWLARKLIRWSAHRRYAPPSRAELRTEELAAYIDDRPGRLFKLITALGFAAEAVVTRKVSFGAAPPTPLWWPTTPTVPVDYEDSGTF